MCIRDRSNSLTGKNKNEIGGLSGRPLFVPSTLLIKEMYNLTGGKITLIGVGGILNGRDAYEKIKAGASLVQLYTGFVYEGPKIINSINLEIKNLLYDEKFTIEGARKVLSQPLAEKKEPIKNNTNTSSMDKKTLMKIQRDLKSILDELQS